MLNKFLLLFSREAEKIFNQLLDEMNANVDENDHRMIFRDDIYTPIYVMQQKGEITNLPFDILDPEFPQRVLNTLNEILRQEQEENEIEYEHASRKRKKELDAIRAEAEAKWAEQNDRNLLIPEAISQTVKQFEINGFFRTTQK